MEGAGAGTILFLNGPFGLLIALPLAAVIRLLGVFEALVTVWVSAPGKRESQRRTTWTSPARNSPS